MTDRALQPLDERRAFPVTTDRGGNLGSLNDSPREHEKGRTRNPAAEPTSIRWSLIAAEAERSAIEERLRRSAERAWGLVDRAIEVLFTLDPEGTITFLGRRFEEETGFARSERLAEPFASIMIPGDRPAASLLVRIVRSGCQTRPVRLRVATRSGEARIWEVCLSRRIVNGEVFEIVGTAFDVTQAGATSRLAADADAKPRCDPAGGVESIRRNDYFGEERS